MDGWPSSLEIFSQNDFCCHVFFLFFPFSLSLSFSSWLSAAPLRRRRCRCRRRRRRRIGCRLCLPECRPTHFFYLDLQKIFCSWLEITERDKRKEPQIWNEIRETFRREKFLMPQPFLLLLLLSCENFNRREWFEASFGWALFLVEVFRMMVPKLDLRMGPILLPSLVLISTFFAAVIGLPQVIRIGAIFTGEELWIKGSIVDSRWVRNPGSLIIYGQWISSENASSWRGRVCGTVDRAVASK